MDDFTGGATGRALNTSTAVLFEEAPIDSSSGHSDVRVRKVELVVRCQELSRFLRGFDETHWASWIDECVMAIRKNSSRGAEMLLNSYHGIGSISDVYLCPEAGHNIQVRDEDAINEQYLLMLSKVNNLARSVLPD